MVSRGVQYAVKCSVLIHAALTYAARDPCIGRLCTDVAPCAPCCAREALRLLELNQLTPTEALTARTSQETDP